MKKEKGGFMNGLFRATNLPVYEIVKSFFYFLILLVIFIIEEIQIASQRDLILRLEFYPIFSALVILCFAGAMIIHRKLKDSYKTLTVLVLILIFIVLISSRIWQNPYLLVIFILLYIVIGILGYILFAIMRLYYRVESKSIRMFILAIGILGAIAANSLALQ